MFSCKLVIQYTITEVQWHTSFYLLNGLSSVFQLRQSQGQTFMSPAFCNHEADSMA